MCGICAMVGPRAGDWAHDSALVTEAVDASAGTNTPYAISTGDSFSGTLPSGDIDWVEINVTAGTEITLNLSGTGADPISDTYLILYNSSGQQVTFNDDGGPGLYSRITHLATEGTYYAGIMTYQTSRGSTGNDTGGYTLTVADNTPLPSGTKPIYTNDQIVSQLIDGYWQDTGRSRRSWDVDVTGGNAADITVNYSALEGAGQWFAQQALAIWSETTGLKFQVTTGTADITFDDENSGAYASTWTFGTSISRVSVNVSKSWISGDHYQWDNYSLQTYLHEIGHALGLGHAGNYNAGSGGTIT